MSDPTDKPLLDDLRTELGELGGELREMAVARWELARLELQADLRSVVRLAIVWLAALLMVLTALPLFVVSLAQAIDGKADIPSSGWLLIFAGALLLLALGGSYFAWRRFRRRFIGLEETLEELREDMLWLKEKGLGTSD